MISLVEWSVYDGTINNKTNGKQEMDGGSLVGRNK